MPKRERKTFRRQGWTDGYWYDVGTTGTRVIEVTDVGIGAHLIPVEVREVLPPCTHEKHWILEPGSMLWCHECGAIKDDTIPWSRWRKPRRA